MPQESGRATAPPGVCYNSLTGSTSEGYTHTIATTPGSTNLIDQNRALDQSPLYTQNFAQITTNYNQKRPQASPRYTPNYSPCPSPSLNYSSTVSKTSNLPFHSPQYTPTYPTASQNYSPNFSSSNYPTYQSNNTINSNSNNFEYPSTSKTSPPKQQPYQDNSNFPSPEHSSAFFNYPKISKPNTSVTPKYTPNYSNFSNFSYFSNNSPKHQSKDHLLDLCSEENPKSKKDFELGSKPAKIPREDSDLNYNIGDLQQLFSKHGTKLKSSQEASSDFVTDSLLHLLQKKSQEKNLQDSFSYDLGDISQLLVSLTSKYKDESSGLKKREASEDSKLMNDFLTKLLLEKEEKRFKSFEEKKKTSRKEIFDDFCNELDEKKIKRDAMSHYQEDKSHHKRPSNYMEFNQWDYLNQQDLQTSNNHNRRGHFFGGTSQAHSMGWNPMGMNMPRQTNPYYSNPHGHVMPAHAHTEYRYNQWNNPNHKNVPNMHNAHSQNTILPQTKHHADIANSVQDFGLPLASTPDLSKMRTSPLIHTQTPEKSNRSGSHPDHLASITPTMRSPSSMRTPTVPTHPKTIINSPLSDLQMLVTNQESEIPAPKTDGYQQESVDLSAHSETKQKENPSNDENKDLSGDRNDLKELSSPVSVTQTPNKELGSDSVEKPVELTSKTVETEITSSSIVNNLEDKLSSCENSEKLVNDKMEASQKENEEKCEESAKPNVIMESEKEPLNNEDAVIPKNDANEPEKREEEESKKEDTKDSTEDPNTDANKESIENQNAVEPVSENKEDTENLKNGKRKAEDEEADSEAKKALLDVESRLEKIFEGIGDENSDLPTVSSTSAEVKANPSRKTKKTPKKKRPSKKARTSRMSSGQSSSSESHFPLKKSKNFSTKDDAKKKVKKSLCDVTDRRGPILHVEGSKESPSAVTVINFPKGDDEDEKDKSFVKKQSSNVIRAKHHNELDYKGRSRNGLFSSTLSARYDSHTKDHTWVCVFCKKGPHYNTLGDLFGPYIISKDESTSACDFSGDEKDISDAQKRGGRNKKSLRSNNMVEHFQKMSKRLRRSQSNESCLSGMTVISDDQVDQLRYEVWVHEQCAVWSPNVCLIGSRIVGMQEAIWSSVKTMCSKCGSFGANIGCVYRNCPNRSHYCCAKESGWSLEQESFISTCHIHKPRS